MYVMSEWLVPFKLQRCALYNGTGPTTLEEAQIVGFSYTPGKPVELIVGVGPHRYFDIPLRFTGVHGGSQYAFPETDEQPWVVMEPRPRRVSAVRLPFAPSATGNVYASLTWDKGNVTLLVVVLDTGEVVLWPPHKISFSEDPLPLPDWLKRRYEDDAPPLALTRVWEEEVTHVAEMLDLAKRALSSPEGWRPHGIGLIQKYTPDKRYRVHVWTPKAVRIGLEGGIHDHRYDFRSTVVAGTLTQEEWVVTPSETGVLHQWEHHNDTMQPTPTGRRFDATPRTLDIRVGQSYSFPRHGYHRSVPYSSIVVTVMERFDVRGTSHALCPTGVVPINGQTVNLPVGEYIVQACKYLGVTPPPVS